MSTYGLLINNNSGQIQVDHTYENLIVNQESDITLTSGLGAIIEDLSPYISDAYSPVIGVQAPQNDMHAMLYAILKTGSDFFRYYLYYGASYGGSPSSETIDYKVWTELSALGTPTNFYGLLVNKPTGGPSFHTDNVDYMKILTADTYDYDTQWSSSPVLGTDYHDVTVVDAYNNFFSIIPQFGVRTTYFDGFLYDVAQFGVGFYALNSTTIRIAPFIYNIQYSASPIPLDDWYLVDDGYFMEISA